MLAVTVVRLGCPVAVQETSVEAAAEAAVEVELEPEAELAVDESVKIIKVTSNVLCPIGKFYARISLLDLITQT